MMKVAAIQMVSGPRPEENLATARGLLEQAAQAGAELAVLPEYFCAMGLRDTDKLAYQETWGEGPIQSFLARTARELGLWIVGGTLPLRTTDPQRVRNTTLVFAPDGRCVARYDKIHLFWFDNGREQFHEGRVIEAGDNAPVQFDLPARDGHRWRVGLSVCYDLRFPELFRWCPAPSPMSPARRIGKCCCAPAPSRTWLTWWHPPRAVCTKTAATPGARAWWPTPGARCWRSRPRAPAWCWLTWTPSGCAACASSCRHSPTAFYEHHFARHLAPLAQRVAALVAVDRFDRPGGVHAGHHGVAGGAV